MPSLHWCNRHALTTSLRCLPLSFHKSCRRVSKTYDCVSGCKRAALHWTAKTVSGRNVNIANPTPAMSIIISRCHSSGRSSDKCRAVMKVTTTKNVVHRAERREYAFSVLSRIWSISQRLRSFGFMILAWQVESGIVGSQQIMSSTPGKIRPVTT